MQNQALNVTTLQPGSLTTNVLTTEYPEAQATLDTFSICFRIAVPYTRTLKDRYLSADYFGCLPSTSAMITEKLTNWLLDHFENYI